MSDEVVDMADVLERVQDDRELLLELFDIFEEDYIEKRKELEQMIANNEIEKIKDMSHSLKGAAGNISAKALHALCHQMEQAAEINDLQSIKNIVPSLDMEFAKLQEFTKNFKSEAGDG